LELPRTIKEKICLDSLIQGYFNRIPEVLIRPACFKQPLYHHPKPRYIIYALKSGGLARFIAAITNLLSTLANWDRMMPVMLPKGKELLYTTPTNHNNYRPVLQAKIALSLKRPNHYLSFFLSRIHINPS
jgi:hypothetical protein